MQARAEVMTAIDAQIDSREPHMAGLSVPAPRLYYDDFARFCIWFGEPNNYSWGWVVDDFGSLVMPHGQITGWGIYECRIDYH